MAHFTLVYGTRAKPQVLVALPYPMETAMRETGFVTKHTAVRGTIIMQMGLAMMENGVTTGRMGKASSVGQIAVNTADSITRARNMAKGPSDGQMAPPMRVHGS